MSKQWLDTAECRIRKARIESIERKAMDNERKAGKRYKNGE